MSLCGNVADGVLFLQHHKKWAGHFIHAGLLGDSPFASLSWDGQKECTLVNVGRAYASVFSVQSFIND